MEAMDHTVEEAGANLKLSPATIRRLIAGGVSTGADEWGGFGRKVNKRASLRSAEQAVAHELSAHYNAKPKQT